MASSECAPQDRERATTAKRRGGREVREIKMRWGERGGEKKASAGARYSWALNAIYDRALPRANTLWPRLPEGRVKKKKKRKRKRSLSLSLEREKGAKTSAGGVGSRGARARDDIF